MHIGEKATVLLVAASIIIFILQAYLMGRSLPKSMLIINIVVIVAAFIFANLRYKTGKVNLNVSFEPVEIKKED